MHCIVTLVRPTPFYCDKNRIIMAGNSRTNSKSSHRVDEKKLPTLGDYICPSDKFFEHPCEPEYLCGPGELPTTKAIQKRRHREEEEDEKLPKLADFICPNVEFLEEQNQPDFICSADDLVYVIEEADNSIISKTCLTEQENTICANETLVDGSICQQTSDSVVQLELNKSKPFAPVPNDTAPKPSPSPRKEIKTTPSLENVECGVEIPVVFQKKSNLVEDTAKRSPFRHSPLKTTSLGEEFKRSSPLDKSSLNRRLPSNKRLSALSIMPKDKFKLPLLKASRHQASERTSLLDSDKKPFLVNIHVVDQTTAPKNDTTMDTEQSTLSVTVQESILETTTQEDMIDQFPNSILETSFPTDCHVRFMEDASWSLDESFREEAFSQFAVELLAEDIDGEKRATNVGLVEVFVNKNETTVDDKALDMTENPQDVINAQKGVHQLKVVLRNMKTFPNRKVFQQHGMKVLLEVTDEEPSLSKVVARGKGIPVIVSAMRRYPYDRMLQCRGIKALCNLSDCEANAEALVLKQDGLSLIIGCITEYSENDEIIVPACQLLAKLSQYEHLKKTIGTDDTISFLAATFALSEDNDEVQDAICHTMEYLL